MTASKVKILDAKQLEFDGFNGLEFTEISDLAYDKDHGLFALSNKGYVFELDLLIHNKKIESAKIKGSFWLKNKAGKVFKKKKRDAEGMDFINGRLLAVSYERKPRVLAFDLAGYKVKNIKIPNLLKDIKNYQSKNSALEALTIHPSFGVITSPQNPLIHTKEDEHILFSNKRRWHFKADAEVTAIQSMPDGNILVLERAFHILSLGHTLWLKKVPIMNCKESFCEAEVLAKLKSSDGWELDNFEGLTYLKDNMYLMISDDNNSFLQKCILVLFEVK